jgi:hypothetical protein
MAGFDAAPSAMKSRAPPRKPAVNPHILVVTSLVAAMTEALKTPKIVRNFTAIGKSFTKPPYKQTGHGRLQERADANSTLKTHLAVSCPFY